MVAMLWHDLLVGDVMGCMKVSASASRCLIPFPCSSTTAPSLASSTRSTRSTIVVNYTPNQQRSTGKNSPQHSTEFVEALF